MLLYITIGLPMGVVLSFDQIIFLFCGLLTVAYSAIVFLWMPDSPMEAKFLDQREKVIAVERLRANQMGIISREWRWGHLWETFYDLKTWLWFILVLAISYVPYFVQYRQW